MDILLCPAHAVQLERRDTRFGYRYQCPCEGCTVASWSGSTSTPADDQTRMLRRHAHAAFDELWNRGHMSRNEAYRRLGEHLGTSKRETHIGMFDAEQCRKTIEFARGMRG